MIKNSETKKNDMSENKTRLLPPEASRALDEARQRSRIAEQKKQPEEIGGRGGQDPTRYGDWEIKGRAIDF